MRMVVLLTGGVATREVVGALDIIHERLGPEIVWAGQARGPVPGHDPPMSFHADVAIGDVMDPPALLFLPGGFGSLDLAADPVVLGALRRLAVRPTVCLATSTGSLPLAAAGLLHGLQVSGHWLSRGHLALHGAAPVNGGLVKADRFITVAGPAHVVEAAHLATEHILFGPGADQRAALWAGG